MIKKMLINKRSERLTAGECLALLEVTETADTTDFSQLFFSVESSVMPVVEQEKNLERKPIMVVKDPYETVDNILPTTENKEKVEHTTLSNSTNTASKKGCCKCKTGMCKIRKCECVANNNHCINCKSPNCTNVKRTRESDDNTDNISNNSAKNKKNKN